MTENNRVTHFHDPVNGEPLPVQIFDPAKPYAIPYLRYSSGKQHGNSSLYRQTGEGGPVEDTNEYIASVILKLPLSETLTDAGLSGFTGEHLLKGALGSLKRRVANEEIPRGCVLILDEWSRLARLPQSESEGLLSDFIRAGIGLYIKRTRTLLTRELIDGPNGFGLIIGAILALRSAWEDSMSRGRGVRVARRRRLGEARETGRVMSGLTPSWLDVVGNRAATQRTFIPHPDRLWVTRRIMLELPYRSFDAVARDLNRDWMQTADADLSRRCTPWGIAKGRKQGSHGWIAATISELAYNRALIGEYQPTSLQPVDPRDPNSRLERRPDGDLMPHYYTWLDPETGERRAAITMEEWAAAHAAIASRRNAAHDATGRRVGKGGRKGEGMPNLFSGKAHCIECGSAMIFRRSKPSPSRPREYVYLQCRSARMGTGCTHRRHHEYLWVESRVGRVLAQEWLFQPGALGTGTPSRAAEQIAADARRLEIIDAAVREWMGETHPVLKEAARATAIAMMGEKTEIEARRPALIKQRDEETGARAGEHGLAVRRLWAMATAVAEGPERYEARRELHAALLLVVDGLYFDDDTSGCWLVFGGRAVVARLADECLDLWVMGPGDTVRQAVGDRLGDPMPMPDYLRVFCNAQPGDEERRRLLNQRRGF